MATNPGPLYDFPWKSMGQYKVRNLGLSMVFPGSTTLVSVLLQLEARLVSLAV